MTEKLISYIYLFELCTVCKELLDCTTQGCTIQILNCVLSEICNLFGIVLCVSWAAVHITPVIHVLHTQEKVQENMLTLCSIV